MYINFSLEVRLQKKTPTCGGRGCRLFDVKVGILHMPPRVVPSRRWATCATYEYMFFPS